MSAGMWFSQRCIQIIKDMKHVHLHYDCSRTYMFRWVVCVLHWVTGCRILYGHICSLSKDWNGFDQRKSKKKVIDQPSQMLQNKPSVMLNFLKLAGMTHGFSEAVL